MKPKGHLHLHIIEAIKPIDSSRLVNPEIRTVDIQSSLGTDCKSREKRFDDWRIFDKIILSWINQRDLFDVIGAGRKYEQLLEAVGVDSPLELGNHHPERFYKKLIKTNAEINLVSCVPSLHQVESWIDKAKTFARIVTY